jgi:hypothetical protein
MKIISLTPDQVAELPIFREQWRERCLRLQWASDDAIRVSVEHLYVAAGLNKPLVMIFDSPLFCLWTRAILKGQLGGQLEGQLWDQLGGQLEGQLWGQLGGQLRDQLGGQLRGQLWGQLEDQGIHQALWFAGGSEGSWVALYVFASWIGVRFTEGQRAWLTAWSDYACTCGPLYAYEGLALVSRRPTALEFDDQQRLHCETAPAMSFGASTEIYAWHGTRIPARWVNDRSNLMAADVMSEANVEVRRAGIEMLGWKAIIDQLGGKVIEADTDPEIGSVIELSLPDLSQPARFLRVRCATGRDFALGLPPDLPTVEGYSLPHCAQAWAASLHPAEWRKPSLTA